MAIIAPGMPAALYPAKVAVFTPMGPGVDSATAIISASCALVNHVYLSVMAERKGMVARPPPTAKSPVLKNS